MVYLPDIINSINQQLYARLSNYPTAAIFGLTMQVSKPANEGQVIYPAIISLPGNGPDAIDTDKKNTFTIYHRALTSSFGLSSPREQFGDGKNTASRMTETQNMKLVCLGRRDRIKVAPEVFASIIADAIPAGTEQTTTGGITLINIQYDPRTVFNVEFQGVRYFIDDKSFLFSIDYKIDNTFMRGCFNNCDC